MVSEPARREISRCRRRTFLTSLLITGILLPRLSAKVAAAPGFTFETVQEHTMALATEPYCPEVPSVRPAYGCPDRPQNRGMTGFVRQGRTIIAVILGIVSAGTSVVPSGAAEVAISCGAVGIELELCRSG